MARNGTGFGNFKFGNFPFGKSDFGRGVVSRSFPSEYTEDEDGNPNELLIHYLLAIEDSVNRVKQEIDTIPDQVDFVKVRTDILQYLGSTIDVTIDDSEPEEFQRSLVGNAIQFYRIKGTLNSYKIRGKISGFDVTVENLYKIAPDLVQFFNSDDLFEFPPGSGNNFTVLAPGSVSGVSGVSGDITDERLSGFSCDYCLTTAIKLNFDVVKVLPPAIIGEGNFFDRLAFKLRDIIPIHVRDLLFEIRATICIPEFENMEVCVSSFDTIHTPIAVCPRIDFVAADTLPFDFGCSVSGIATVSG